MQRLFLYFKYKTVRHAIIKFMDRHHRGFIINTGEAYTKTDMFTCIDIPLHMRCNSGFENIGAGLNEKINGNITVFARLPIKANIGIDLDQLIGYRSWI